MALFSLWTIETLCGQESFKIGKEYGRQGRVVELHQDHEVNYEAIVEGKERYKVKVELTEEGRPEASCECSNYRMHFQYCEHIAAVLFEILKRVESGKHPDLANSQNSAGPSSREERAAAALIRLFDGEGNQPLKWGGLPPAKETLQTEFFCSVEEGLYSDSNPKFTISMKVGTKRTYVVQDLHLFLEHVELNKPLPFSRHFEYDPVRHEFRTEDREILRQLIQIRTNEEIYFLSEGIRHGKRSPAAKRSLTIPPMAWKDLLPALINAKAMIEQPGGFTAEMSISTGTPPISFELGIEEDRFYLEVSGLDEAILLPKYGCIVARGTVFEMPRNRLQQLVEMKETLYRAGLSGRLGIPSSQIDALIQTAIPKLRALGQVRLDRQIQSRILQPKLRAKLYLDRNEDLLKLRLEFHYDGILILPLQPLTESEEEERDSILLRDSDKERDILNRIAALGLSNNGTEWLAVTDEQIYEVLFTLLPGLEGKAEVYATTAVRDFAYADHDEFEMLADADASLNWLEVNFSMAGISEAEIRRILLAVLERKKFYRLRDGAFVSLEGQVFQKFAGLYADLGMRKSDIVGSSVRLPLVRSLLLKDPGEAGIRMGKALRRFLERVRDPELMDFEVPNPLEGVLRDYQKQGFRWLKTLAHYRFGGILADDMGLGKTLQSIAFILSDRLESDGLSTETKLPVLIVSPASLVYNWESEFRKFAPELKVTIAAGTKQEREDTVNAAAEADVIVTSYPALRRDSELYKDVQFSTLILDEAQAFKNHTTQTAQAVKRINAGRRFALTGTPIENSLDELWSIFDAVSPGLFTGRSAFKDMPGESLSRLVRPFILRRLKSQVLRELPDKIESVQQSELTVDQKKLYGAYLGTLQKQTMRDLESEGFQKSRIKILAGITRLRQLCCHPALFVDSYQGSSGKLQQLTEIVDECLSSHKRLLIFSQFTGMLQLIRRELAQKGISTFYLDGQTPSRERVELCQRFNEGEKEIFLISLKAGGTGLNLTGADTVILYDLWWNPAVEEQAAGRAHRLGQKHTVQVIRMVAKGTIEDKMLELQQRKKNLIHDVIGDIDAEVSMWTEQDIKDLLMISTEG